MGHECLLKHGHWRLYLQVSLALMRWTCISPYSVLQVSSYWVSLSGFSIANSTSIGQLVSEGKASDAILTILTPIPCVLNVEIWEWGDWALRIETDNKLLWYLLIDIYFNFKMSFYYVNNKNTGYTSTCTNVEVHLFVQIFEHLLR